jgi:hypothetical protein
MNYKTYNLGIIQLINLILSLLLLNSVHAEWQGGYDIPKPYKEIDKKITFNPDNLIKIDNKGILEIANQATPWAIRIGQAAYMRIVIPAGVEILTITINDASLAASQSVMFKDYGEMDCEDQIPDSPKIINGTEKSEVKFPEWKILTGSNSPFHNRDENFFEKASCVFFGFANIDNDFGTGIKFQKVGVTYQISDIPMFEKWVKGDLKLSIDKPENGKVTITNNLNTDSKVCPDDCTPTDYPAGTEVTLKAEANDGYVFGAWEGDCKDKTGDNITITMDTSKTCSALFEPKPVTLIVDPAPDNGIIITYFTNDITCGNNKEDLKLICSNRTEDLKQLCSATYSLNSEAILVAVPDMGFTLDSWGEDCSSEKTESYVILKMDQNKKCSVTFTK